MGQSKNRQVAKIAVFITSIFVICISVAYAFLNQTLTGIKRQVITAGNLELELKEGNAITLENALPMYDEVGMIQKEFTFTLTNKSTQSTNYTLRLKDVTTGTNKLNTSLVKYGLTKDGEILTDLLSNLENNVIDSGIIKGNQTINYSLRLWINHTVENENLIKGKFLGYQIEVEAKLTAKSVVFDTIAENLGTKCTTYDDGTDTFLVGQCNRNYVWYSGKLWRIVFKSNKTGIVKMVTDNAITSIPYNEKNHTAFEDSYIDQWLNQEFLLTLHDYEDYLVVDSIWDATLDGSNGPDRPIGTTTVTRTIGLLNSYEYYTTYNNSYGLAISETGIGYLYNGPTWWLMTPCTASFVRVVSNFGTLFYNASNYGNGVRPSVNLQSTIRITSGDGTQFNPYRLEGDSQETVGGTTLLSTRYSGEYITFNNELYRIVGVEDNKTKITAVDKPATLVSNQFDSSTTNFDSSSIKTDLETYYQENVAEPYKSMIEPNQIWYLETVGDGVNYKESICKTVNQEVGVGSCERTDIITTASVGLPRAGEMFTSQITRGTRAQFWTLTPYSASNVRSVSNIGLLNPSSPSNGYGARPSMYLKSNVVISKDNTGDGTYEHPYTIELGE